MSAFLVFLLMMTRKRLPAAQALQALGWTAERNIRIEYRWGAMEPGHAQKLAAELATLAHDAPETKARRIAAFAAAPYGGLIVTVGRTAFDRDVVIVGARPAGAATALLLARHGLRVVALERSRPGTDALSTHALTRAGVAQLR